MEVVQPRWAGLDVSKRDVKVCVRIQGRGSRPTRATVTTWGSTTRLILALRDMLVEEGVGMVVIESTGTYWKPFYYLLEDHLALTLVNAREAKTVPGRKTDVADAEWLADLGAHGLVRASLVPPPPIRELGDLTRTGPPLCGTVPGRCNGWRSFSRTPRSNCPVWLPTSAGLRAAGSSPH
jgi:transposase